MQQADVTQLVSRLRVAVRPTPRRVNWDPEKRLLMLRRYVTALLKFERIELNEFEGSETRVYAERLISDAIRYGDCHAHTMEMADYWLLEKQLVHKLFKVVAPRLKTCHVAYTRMIMAPRAYPEKRPEKIILELRGNPHPPLFPQEQPNKNYIQNVLLSAASREFRAQRQAAYAAIAKQQLRHDATEREADTEEGRSAEPFSDGSEQSEASADVVRKSDSKVDSKT